MYRIAKYILDKPA